MGTVVGTFNPLRGDVGINLGGREAGVTQETLDTAQVSAGIKKMGSKAMAQLVRAGHHGNLCLAQVLFDHTPDGSRS